MSEINKQLNALSQQQSRAGAVPPLQAAVVKPVPSHPRRWRAVAAAGLLVVTGGAGWWLGVHARPSSPADTVAATAVEAEMSVEASVETAVEATTAAPEPTVVSSVRTEPPLPQADTVRVTAIASAPKSVSGPESKPESKPGDVPVMALSSRAAVAVAPKPQAPQQEATPIAAHQPAKAASVSSGAAPLKQAAVAAVPAQTPAESQVETTGNEAGDELAADEALVIETVELDGEQLSRVAYQRAEQALKSGDSRKAIRHLREAVQYQPDWILARQKLAALQYGRGESRQAMATLQDGLALDADQPDLRLTLAKLLVNESQPQAALNVLSQLPEAGRHEYLAMRGALAQQLDQPELAMTSYQRLVDEQPYDGRWWMGLGIALERNQTPARARDAYQQALLMGRISQQSQQFIQQRLALLEAQEG
ncbi:tetratricopeptide repeat protein [Photobacterium sp. TY1-4]|uniref:tetratricopeptide repeat protein n=1 Tax=Photobacterium sp. TY1-4 TaxID=2899122 RepID=UPI0021BE2DE1|nr:tetratricopeptide repeat protein [Photobacterium sp. TY1-4]UXI01587.1 tetratricopeptide repeat protein [Photobacterium sp. TY1-4]